MNAEQISTAAICLDAAHQGTLTFPEIVGKLITAGFESYEVDYRRNAQTFHLPDGDSVILAMHMSTRDVAATFDAVEIERLVRWAQENPADYSYRSFCEKARAAGCAGYMVSFSGRRVVYFGRTAEVHVEHFPN